jgi:hypothetical protein
MSVTDQMFISGVLTSWAVLNIYGEWYWRCGKGKAKRLRKRLK